jgi:sodium--glutamate symport carrier gltS
MIAAFLTEQVDTLTKELDWAWDWISPGYTRSTNRRRIFTLLVVFHALGKDYQAAVLSAGFIGISLGSTPTAIAAMTAVTKRYGPSPSAFIILPLASALLVSLVNVAAITLFLSL